MSGEPKPLQAFVVYQSKGGVRKAVQLAFATSKHEAEKESHHLGITAVESLEDANVEDVTRLAFPTVVVLLMQMNNALGMLAMEASQRMAREQALAGARNLGLVKPQ